MLGFRQHHGGIVVDGRHTADTLQCVHCGYNWEIQVGSGIERGWCGRCSGAVCGAESCMKSCTPLEARIELTEARDKRNEKKVDELLSLYPEIKTL